MAGRLNQESWAAFAERQIRQAQQAGEFDNLPGFGQPIPGIDDPLREDWWLQQKLRNEGLSVLPPVLQARLDKEKFLESLASIASEVDLLRRLRELNEQIREAHFSPIAGPPEGVAPLDEAAVVERWRRVRAGQSPRGS